MPIGFPKEEEATIDRWRKIRALETGTQLNPQPLPTEINALRDEDLSRLIWHGHLD